MIDILPYSHRDVNEKKEEGMKWTYVVQNIRISHCETKEHDKKVQTPEHLKYTYESKISSHVEETEISESGEPNVSVLGKSWSVLM